MAEVTAELMFEPLKSVQARLAQVDGKIDELQQETQASRTSENGIRQDITSVFQEISSIHATLVRHESRLGSHRDAPRIKRRSDAMKSAVLVFPGINRERDMARALKLVSGREAAMVWHGDTKLPTGTDLVVVPGGFSYGDYLRCGAIAARSPVMDAVRSFAGQGGLVLGVCNGFQILCEAGLLPGVLMRNAKLKFICKDVHLRVERSDTPFTRGYNAGQVIRVPVAHGEGNYEADEETLKRLEGEGRVLYRYCSPEGSVDEGANINGAAHSIAGIVNERGNVLGMMPHPENHVEDIMGCTDGRGLFAGLVAHLDQAA